jgi:hypothetical protein
MTRLPVESFADRFTDNKSSTTTDSVLTGAWQLPKERRLALFFANVSDQPLTATLRFDANEYGIRAKTLRCRVIGDGAEDASVCDFPSRFEQPIEFKPRCVQAWELSL